MGEEYNHGRMVYSIWTLFNIFVPGNDVNSDLVACRLVP